MHGWSRRNVCPRGRNVAGASKVECPGASMSSSVESFAPRAHANFAGCEFSYMELGDVNLTDLVLTAADICETESLGAKLSAGRCGWLWGDPHAPAEASHFGQNSCGARCSADRSRGSRRSGTAHLELPSRRANRRTTGFACHQLQSSTVSRSDKRRTL